jgi:hypothetical protein
MRQRNKEKVIRETTGKKEWNEVKKSRDKQE